MKNLIITSQTRDEIVRFLQAQVVPANVGAGLIQVCTLLNNLAPQEPVLKTQEEKTDDTNQEPKV
jgi:hypothetical protein